MIDIQDHIKKMQDEWGWASWYNIHSRKTTMYDCANIGHAFCWMCPDCKIKVTKK